MKKQYKNQPGQAKKTEPIPSVNLQEKKPSFGTTFLKKYWPFLLIAASFLMLTTPNLGKFYTTDESVWLFGRVPTYWDALEDGKLENTYICNKPGVTTAIFTGPVYAWQSPNKSLILGTQSTYLFLWRFSQILFVLLVLWLCFYRLQQDYGSWLASVFVGLTAFYPVILGMARVVNPDNMLWAFVVLYWLYHEWAEKSEKLVRAVIPGVFLGLAMLSKYNAGLFYVFIPIWWFVKYFFGMNDYAKTMRGLWLFLVEFAVSVLVVMVLMPAVFLDFALLWKSTLGIVYLKPIYAAIPLLMLVFVLVLREKWMLWFGSKDSALIIAKYAVVSLIVVLVVASGIVAFRNSADVIPVDAKQFNVPFKPAILFNTLMVGWVASWPFILGLCVCVWAIFRHNLLQKAPQVMGVMLFVWLFIAGSSFQGVQLSARYTIMLFPLLAYIVALAVQQVKIPKVWIVIPMLLFPLTDFGLLKPSGMVFYTNNYYWTNDGHLLWGFGGYEIAEKANRLPNAEDLKVLVDYHGFAIFFHGDSDFMEKQMTNAVMDDYDYLYLSTAGYRSKVSWDMLSSDLDFYYQLPDDSAVFVNRDKNTFTRLIKVNKSRTMVFPPNFINTELLIERNTPYTLGAWLQLFNTDQGSPFAIFTTDVATDLQLRVNKGVLSFAGNSVELPHQKKQGEWHLVVITNSDKLRLWYDAKLLAEWPAVNYKSRIALSKNFVGDEDGFRIYYESLTPDLVKAWYNNGVMDHSLLLYRNNEEITMVRNYYKKMNKE